MGNNWTVGVHFEVDMVVAVMVPEWALLFTCPAQEASSYLYCHLSKKRNFMAVTHNFCRVSSSQTNYLRGSSYSKDAFSFDELIYRTTTLSPFFNHTFSSSDIPRATFDLSLAPEPPPQKARVT
ncbi:hypothetical protein Hamer_G026712 [Homarus americanus]|uniref:Uncharacterized protein n=1 Tax=Homarus americanus TaxID=6706 RepID=A0A8J5TL31_HOMAM|nr:hypothetical protein Hamer_G026712 [Homarus americanus]